MKERIKDFFTKLFSIKTIVTIWSMVLITCIVFKNKTDFLVIAELLAPVPLGYMGANVLQKKILKDKEKENEENGN